MALGGCRESLSVTGKAVSLLLLLLILCVLSTQSSAQPVDDERRSRTGGLYEICVLDNPPLAFCENLTEGNYTGYEVKLWQETMQWIDMPREAWYMRCFESRDKLLQDLLNPNGTCFSVMGGMPVDDTLRYDEQLEFSYPTYRQGIRILIDSETSSNVWSIFHPFSLTVWIVVVSTSILTALLIWFFEEVPYWFGESTQERSSNGPIVAIQKNRVLKRIKRSVRGDHGDGLKDTVWNTTGNVIGIALSEPYQLSSRLILFAYGLMILILIALYTAAVTADVTTMNMVNDIKNFEDLTSKKAIVSKYYMYKLLQSFNIQATVVPWDTNADLENAIKMLEDGTVDAIVAPDTWARYWDAQKCNLYAVGDLEATFDLAFAFPKGTNKTKVEYINSALLAMQRTDMTMDRLAEDHINLVSDCPSPDPEGAFQVDFIMVAGLWVLLGGGLAIGSLLLLVPVVLNAAAKRPIFSGTHMK